MPPKVLKNRTQFTSTLQNQLYKDLQQMSKETQIPISRLLDTAVLQLTLNHMTTKVHMMNKESKEGT